MTIKFHGSCSAHELTFSDAAAYHEHLLGEHKLTKRRLVSVRLPKLKPAGGHIARAKPFNPTGLEPGAEVEWDQDIAAGTTTELRYSPEHGCDLPTEVPVSETVTRRGQVWSSGYRPKSAWVIPFERLSDNELAVLVVEAPDRVVYSETCISFGKRPMTSHEAHRLIGARESWTQQLKGLRILSLASSAKWSGDTERLNRLREAADVLKVTADVQNRWPA